MHIAFRRWGSVRFAARLTTNPLGTWVQFMYLTSRAIGQSDATKEYLTHIRQSAVSSADPAVSSSVKMANVKRGVSSISSTSTTLAAAEGAPSLRDKGHMFNLPLGPVFTSPDRLVTAFTREVIHRRPQEFKIPSLVSVLELFPQGCHPFYAGFGNRGTDVQAYQAVGIPVSKIFIINPAGEVRLPGSVASLPDKHLQASPSLSPMIGSSSPARIELSSGSDSALHKSSTQSPGSVSVPGAGTAAASQAYCKSYPLLSTLVSEMFPYIASAPITASRVGSHYGVPVALDEHFGDVNFWRRPMPIILDNDYATAMAAKPDVFTNPVSNAAASIIPSRSVGHSSSSVAPAQSVLSNVGIATFASRRTLSGSPQTAAVRRA